MQEGSTGGPIEAGGGGSGGCACAGLWRRRLTGELADGIPVAGGLLRRGGRLPGLQRRDRIAEQVAAGDGGGRGPAQARWGSATARAR